MSRNKSGNEYKWMLRPGGKKDTCPQCGRKRFVPYVLTADNTIKAGPEYGRCDREQSCGYFRYPGREVAANDWRKPEPLPELPPALFSARILEEHGVTVSNTLFRAFAWLVGTGRLKTVMEAYCCGTGGKGECMFYQYDGKFVRTAKAIMYGADGHRLKDDSGESLPVWWMHKALEHRHYMQSHQLRQCLFGQHLLRLYPSAEVWVVEAEKTAVLMAAADDRPMEERLWLACGGSQMLKGAIDLSCLDGRKVTLVPDDGQYWNWKRTAEAHRWHCWTASPLTATEYELQPGWDIWDLREKALGKGK